MFPSSHYCKQCCIDVFAQSSSGTGIRNSLGYIPQCRIAESKRAARCLGQILPDCSQDTHPPFHAVAQDHPHCCASSPMPGIESLGSLPIREWDNRVTALPCLSLGLNLASCICVLLSLLRSISSLLLLTFLFVCAFPYFRGVIVYSFLTFFFFFYFFGNIVITR